MFLGSSVLSTKMLVLKRLLAFLIFATLAFIFIQSALPPEAAEQESSAVVDVIKDALPDDSGVADFAEENISEIAHVTEFSILGFLVSLYISLFSVRRGICAAFSLLFASLAAYFDETIQIFSGRTYDFNDMHLDMLGFVLASVAVYIGYLIYRKKEK